MADNVKTIFGGPVIQREPDPLVIEELEAALEAAQSGECVGVLVVRLNFDDTTQFARRGYKSRGMMGAVTCAQFDMAQEMNDAD